MVISAIGMIRLPDFYLRMSAITKAATLGLALLLIGLSIHFNNLELSIKSLIIISLVFLTSPVGAHAIARAAYKQGTEFWDGAVIDELKQWSDQKKMIEKQLLVTPDDAKHLGQLITLLMKLPEAQGGNLKKAIRMAKQLVRVEPLEGHRRLAELYQLSKKWKKLEMEETIVCEISAYENSDVQHFIKALTEQDKYAEAAEIIEKALKHRRTPIFLHLATKLSAKYNVNMQFGLQCAYDFMKYYPDHSLFSDVEQYGQKIAHKTHQRWQV